MLMNVQYCQIIMHIYFEFYSSTRFRGPSVKSITKLDMGVNVMIIDHGQSLRTGRL
jgi:hypothetical protein